MVYQWFVNLYKSLVANNDLTCQYLSVSLLLCPVLRLDRSGASFLPRCGDDPGGSSKSQPNPTEVRKSDQFSQKLRILVGTSFQPYANLVWYSLIWIFETNFSLGPFLGFWCVFWWVLTILNFHEQSQKTCRRYGQLRITASPLPKLIQDMWLWKDSLRWPCWYMSRQYVLQDPQKHNFIHYWF